MEFFNSAVNTLQTIVIGLGGGLCVWGGVNLLEGYGQDNPVFGKVSAVLEDGSADFTNTVAIDIDVLGVEMAGNAGGILGQGQNIAVLHDENIFFWNPCIYR